MTYALTEYRESNNISMEDWAKKMSVSVETATAWEENKQHPTTQQLHKISKITGMGISSLLNKGEYDEYIHNRRGAYISIIFAEVIWLILTSLIVYSLIQPIKTLDTALLSWFVLVSLFAVMGVFTIISCISGSLSKWYKSTRIAVTLITVLLFVVTLLSTAFL